jgi:cytochrome oxidase Cu insertion factor (SCO1/SenC/PrrC family)
MTVITRRSLISAIAAAAVAPLTAACEASGPARSGPGGSSIPDVALFDQNGKRLRFYTDLVAGRTVAIQFIYTRCTKICLPQGERFGALRRRLWPKFGANLNLISITLDPARDSISDMANWGRARGAGPGWHLLSGRRAEVDRLLVALRGSPADPSYHAPALLVGNEPRAIWERVYALASDRQLASTIERVAAGQRQQRVITSPDEASLTRG